MAGKLLTLSPDEDTGTGRRGRGSRRAMTKGGVMAENTKDGRGTLTAEGAEDAEGNNGG